MDAGSPWTRCPGENRLVFTPQLEAKMSSHFFDRFLSGGRHGHGGSHRGGGGWGNPHGPATYPPPQPERTPERVIVCPKCRSDNSPSARFCAQCGDAFGSTAIACPKCGAEVDGRAKFCPSCGQAKG